MCVLFKEWRGTRLDPFNPAVTSFGTETPWDKMTHHNTVLMRDTHAGLAPVLEEIRSVNPNMHGHDTARATDNKRRAEERLGRGVGKQSDQSGIKGFKCMVTEGFGGNFYLKQEAMTENVRLRKVCL